MSDTNKTDEQIAAHIDATIIGAANDIANTGPGDQANMIYRKSAHVGSVLANYGRTDLAGKALDLMTKSALEMDNSGKPWTPKSGRQQADRGLEKGLANPTDKPATDGMNRKARRRLEKLQRQSPVKPSQPQTHEFPTRTPPVDGKPHFISGAKLPPHKNEQRRHYYLRADRQPVVVKIMRSKDFENRATIFYRVDEPESNTTGWQAGRPEGHQPVPYNLTGFTDPEFADEPLLIVEGERDVDTLVNQGCGNVLTYGSAGALGDGFEQYLSGRHVVVIGDNDQAGQNHVTGISDRLSGIAASVRGMTMKSCVDGSPAPDGFDITDYFETGGTLDGFLALVDKAPDTMPTDEPEAPPQQIHNQRTSAPARNFGMIDTNKIMATNYPPLKWTVRNYLAEGFSVLAGRQKLGKTWLAFDWAIAVATGGYAMGGVACDQADVLYIDMENGQRRIQRRIDTLFPDKAKQPDLARLQWMTDAPALDAGFIDVLENWRVSVQSPRLIVVDVLQRIKPPGKAGRNAYENDYASFMGLQRWATETGVALLALHHTRKGGADDPLEALSGSNGLSAVADTTLLLDRDGNGTTLYVRGRDVEERETALQFHGGIWSMLGEASEVRRTDERSKILAVLEVATEPLGPRDIADETGMKANNVRRMVSKMVHAGEIIKVGRGRYVHPSNPCRSAA